MQVYDIPLNKDQKEITQHGSAAFPIAIYETFPRRNVMGSVIWHWHEEIQFCYVTSGQIRFTINNRSWLISEGEGIFISSNILHMAESTQSDDDAYVCMDFHPILLYGFSGSILARRYVSPVLDNTALSCFHYTTAECWQKDSLVKLHEIYSLYRHKSVGYEMDIVIRLLQVWRALFTHVSRNAAPAPTSGGLAFRRDNERVKLILNYLHSHYKEKLTLDDIAAAISVNKNECCRFFKNYTGKSIFTYLTDYRIAQSIDLLLSTDLPVHLIAADCGFSTTSYFIEQFKKKNGVTPKEFRNNAHI